MFKTIKENKEAITISFKITVTIQGAGRGPRREEGVGGCSTWMGLHKAMHF